MHRPPRALPLLGLAALVLGLGFTTACDDDASDDGATPTPIVPTPGEPPAVPTPGEPPPPQPETGVIVTVVGNGRPLAGVRVVFHDEGGAVLAADGDHRTDASGVVNRPVAPKMITVFLTREGEPDPDVDLVTYTGVEEGDRLVVDATRSFAPLTELKAYAASLGAGVEGADSYYVAASRFCSGSAFDTSLPVQVDVTEECLLPENNALLARAFDVDFNVIAYAGKRGLAPPPSATPMAVTLDPWAPPTTLTFTITNLPTSGQDHLFSEAVALVDGISFAVPHDDDTPAGGFHYAMPPASFAAAHQVALREVVPDAFPTISRVLVRRAAAAATTSVDYSANLPTMTGAVLEDSDFIRPSVTWTSARPFSGADAADAALVRMSWIREMGSFHSWTLVAPSSATSVKVPALPADAELLGPGADGALDLLLDGVVIVDSDAASTYKDIKKVPVRGDYDGMGDVGRALPADGLFRATSFGVFLSMLPAG